MGGSHFNDDCDDVAEKRIQLRRVDELFENAKNMLTLVSYYERQ